MYFENTYGESFDKAWKKLNKQTHAYELCELDGVGDQTDEAEFNKKFYSVNTTTTADVSIDPNANVSSLSVLHYIGELHKPQFKMSAYANLWNFGCQLYNSEIAYKMLEAQFNKSIYIHDAHFYHLLPYCFNFSSLSIISMGLSYVDNPKVDPPQHMSSYVHQSISFLSFAGNHLVGATAMSDWLVGLSYFVGKLYAENKNIPTEYLNREIKQNMQAFVFSINQPYRSALQSLFFNISLYDDTFLDKWTQEYTFPDGTHPNKEIVKFLQEMFLDLILSIYEKSPITFPIITACFAVDKDKNILDQKFLKYISEKNCKFGFINIFAGKTSLLSSCCRLKSDSSHDYFSSFGNGSSQIGSLSVTTINLPRVAFTSKNEDDFIEKLKEMVILTSQVNHVKRYIIKKLIDNNHAPLYNHHYMSLKKQFSTCGLIGIYEAVEILGKSLLKEDGQFFAKKMLDVINEVNDEQQKKYGYPINCEQIPGENVSTKLAQVDKLLGYNKKYVMYSNQFIPLTAEADILDRIKLQGMFDSALSGGSICHLNFADRITPEYMIKIITEAVKKGVVYHAINYLLQVCENHHITVGKNKLCPICSKKITDSYERIVGYTVNTKHWSKTRREYDQPNRVRYSNKEKDLTPSQ
jgi:ribonucleoside-triphosphate reductase